MFRFGFVSDVDGGGDGDGGGGEGTSGRQGEAAGAKRGAVRRVDVKGGYEPGTGGTSDEAGVINIGDAGLAVSFCRLREATAAVGRQRWGNSDLVQGEYEGGYKLWEGAMDLMEYIDGRVRAPDDDPQCSLRLDGASVVELGCGFGLPGIACCKHYNATRLLLQDYNEEVLVNVTARNARLNLAPQQLSPSDVSYKSKTDVDFVAGDWWGMRSYLEGTGMLYSFDLVVSTETAYNVDNLESLVDAIHACLKPRGTCLVSTKRYYFGVGGGTSAFMEALAARADLYSCIVHEVCDGSSNVRDIVLVRKREA